MGGGIARRLAHRGHHVVAFDRDQRSLEALEGAGVATAPGLGELIAGLDVPRVIWVMVPAGSPTEETIAALSSELHRGDIIIDGGNSRYTDTMRRHDELSERGIQFLDVGTSGGVRGETDGYCLMVGGDEEPFETVRPILRDLAPAEDQGWGRVGPSGSGHFVKMIHNGIEYGMMQAYAEGFAILKAKQDLAPDLENISRIWQSGSVIRSWLLELATELFAEDQELRAFPPHVGDSGEGRWTVAEAIDLDVPAPVITLSLLERLRSRDEESFSDRVLNGLRNRFGGHATGAD